MIKKLKLNLALLLAALILIIPVGAFYAGNSEVVMNFSECQELIIHVNGELPIESGEYSFSNCTENITVANMWNCNCSDGYELIMNIGLDTLNNYTLNTGFADDLTAPLIDISNSPNDQGLEADTTKVILNITTNEYATCKYYVGSQDINSGNISYTNMTNNMTYDYVNTFHFFNSTVNVSYGNSYYYYIRCKDIYGNTNNESTQIKFLVEEYYFPSSGGSSHHSSNDDDDEEINTTNINSTPIPKIVPKKVDPIPSEEPTKVEEEVVAPIEPEKELSNWWFLVVIPAIIIMIWFIIYMIRKPNI